MATVNKDFKIKNGLVVEGSTATVNGNQVLSETASDQYIIDLIGGETLVTSVESTQMEVIAGELNIKSGVFDADGSAAAAETAANSYTDGEITTALQTAQGYADTAESNAESYADGLASNYDPAGSASAAQTAAQSYADGLASNYDPAGSASTAQQNAEDYADGLINDASISSTEVWSAYKTSTEIGLAQAAAEQHADDAVANLVGAAPELLNTLEELATALENNPDIIADLESVASGKQDTLTAGSNIDITGVTISVTGLDAADISDFTSAARGSIAAGTGIDYNSSTGYIDANLGTGLGLDGSSQIEINRATVDAWYDANGAAAQALTDAEAYADALTTDDIEEGEDNLYFTEQRAKDVAQTLLVSATKTNISITSDPMGGIIITAENGVADSDTDDLTEGSSNLYFTDERVIDAIDNAVINPQSVDINIYRKEEATQQVVASTSTVTAHTFTGNRSVKYLVRTVGNVSGTLHSQVTELLVTVDGGNNVAVTEYGTIYTSTTPLSTATVDYDGGSSQYRLRVTTLISGAEVVAAATIMSWAD